MTQDFWWFALVGFMIGFVLSTLWEWLHFRGKRMRIQNRRIAELEAALRAAQAQINSAPPVAPHPWPAADFQDSAVYLETEEGAGAPVAATQLPAARPVPFVAAATAGAANAGRDATAPAPPTQAAGPDLATAAVALATVAAVRALTDDADAQDDTQEGAGEGAADGADRVDSAAGDVTGSATAQVEPAGEPEPAPAVAAVEDHGNRFAAAALAAGAAALVAAGRADDAPTAEQPPAAEAPPATISPQATDTPVELIHVAVTAAEATQAANTPGQAADAATVASAAAAAPELYGAERSYSLDNLSRSEYATVRLLQSVRHSARGAADRIGLGRFLPPDPNKGDDHGA